MLESLWNFQTNFFLIFYFLRMQHKNRFFEVSGWPEPLNASLFRSSLQTFKAEVRQNLPLQLFNTYNCFIFSLINTSLLCWLFLILINIIFDFQALIASNTSLKIRRLLVQRQWWRKLLFMTFWVSSLVALTKIWRRHTENLPSNIIPTKIPMKEKR